MSTIKEIHNKISGGFFGFRVKRWRVTVLVILMIIGLGAISLRDIPKESSPTIDLGFIMINTLYIGASPNDIDELVTSEIEEVVDGIDGIDKVDSSSSTNFSNITITLEQGYDIDKALSDIKAEVDKANLPTDAEDPVIETISTDTDSIFNLLVYADEKIVPYENLIELAKQIEFDLEGKPAIDDIVLNLSENYDIRVILDQQKIEQLGLDISGIAQIVRSYVTNIPLGNYQIEESTYDFRIDKTITSEEELLKLAIPTNNGAVLLGSLARIDHDYSENTVRRIGKYKDSGYHYVSLTFKKPKSLINVQSAANMAKEDVTEYMKQFVDDGIKYDYGMDVAVSIKQSYDSVTKNGLITLVLVFFAVLLFVSLKESIIATLSIPLAFLITFFVFQTMGMTLNFLTNFSMIVTFGIAIDTIIVILEGAAEKRKMGYSPYSSALLALHEFKTPLIASTTTTCVVFIPLFTLPGTLGKFLSFIPITIFTVLVAALFVSLLINPTLFYLFNKDNKKYLRSPEEKYLSSDEKILLEKEREGKVEVDGDELGRRHRVFEKLVNGYENIVRKLVYASRGRKRFYFILPILFFIGSNMLPIKSTQFPESDANFMQLSIIGPAGSHYSFFEPYQEQFEATLSSYPELKNYSYTVNGNEVGVGLELYLSTERSKLGLRDSFELTDILLGDLVFLEQNGMRLDLLAESGGPPGVKAVGVNLIAQNNKYFQDLQTVAKEFEEFFNKQDDLIEVVNSSQQTAGQFVFVYKKAVLQELGLTPGQVSASVSASMNGRIAGTLASLYGDHDIKLVFDSYIDEVSPTQVQDLIINTPVGPIRLGDVATYTSQSNINAIKRKDGNIVVTVEADVTTDLVAGDVKPTIKKFAEEYTFPEGVSYKLSGENAENAGVNGALAIGLIVALFMIFIVLLLQFNSFRMPLFIFYAIVMALMGANIGLFITGNPRSMAFSIGFISLIGIVVNDAIVFIDKINVNIRRGMERKEAIIDGGKTRLQPIILTTITTILGLSSVVREDAFFAGLGYTIMFGLFVGSLMTLFIVPVLYSLFVSDKKAEKIREGT